MQLTANELFPQLFTSRIEKYFSCMNQLINIGIYEG